MAAGNSGHFCESNVLISLMVVVIFKFTVTCRSKCKSEEVNAAMQK